MRKKLLTLTLLLTTLSAWALDKDSNGYYLIGSASDWRDFASLVQREPAANAKMTANVDLGDDQTMVGTFSKRYAGIFDGQGHTLTINYNTSGMTIESGQSYLGAAPFRDIEGATIRNLHTAGKVTADKIGITGLVGWTYGTNTIERCWSSVDLVSSNSSADTFAGFVFRQDGDVLNINDCFYSGKIQSVLKRAHAGFVGHHTNGICNVSNSLLILAEGTDNPVTDTYTFVRNLGGATINIVNSHYLTPFGIEQGTATKAEELANGTTTSKLQAGRQETVWIQDAATRQPKQKVFKDAEMSDALSIASVSDWRRFAALVEDYPSINAKMTADVDLGDDQTMIGTEASPFQGTFDGQGHTLTVHLEGTENGIAPFRFVKSATIEKVHVKGSIHTTGMSIGGIVCTSLETSNDMGTTVRECWVSAHLEVDITWGILQNSIGGIFANPASNCVIEDCLFDGVVAEKNDRYNGGFVNHSMGVTIKNSLNLGTFPTNTSGCSTFNRVGCPMENIYYLNPFGAPQGQQVTVEELASGTVTEALQAGRPEQVWVQDESAQQPRLKVFKDGGPDDSSTSYNELICWLKDGGTASWRFSEKPKVQLKSGVYTISSTRATVSYNANDVKKYTLRRVSAVGIGAPRLSAQNKPFVKREDGQLMFSGCNAGEVVMVYNTAGRQIARQQVGSDGCLQLSLGSLPAGVYLVKTESVTLKIAIK